MKRLSVFAMITLQLREDVTCLFIIGSRWSTSNYLLQQSSNRWCALDITTTYFINISVFVDDADTATEHCSQAAESDARIIGSCLRSADTATVHCSQAAKSDARIIGSCLRSADTATEHCSQAAEIDARIIGSCLRSAE
jgi:hypothetical protein